MVLLGVVGCEPPAAKPPAKQLPPPSPPVVDLTGKEVGPIAQADGPVALIFVRSDCPISNRYAPELARLLDEYPSRGVAMHLVYCDSSQTPAAIAKHLKEYNLPDHALIDAGHRLVKLTGATITPEAAVFDAKGQMVYRGRIDDRFVDFGQARPAATEHDLREALEALLAGKPIKKAKTQAVGCYITDLQ